MEREFLVRGENVVSLRVKQVLDGRLYVSSARGPDMVVRGKSDAIPSGAILWCASGADGGPLRARAFDGGLYDATRVLLCHVDDGYEAELAALEADPARLVQEPGRPFEIERIRGFVEREGWALGSFTASLFEALRERWLLLRELAEGCDVSYADRLADVARFLRGVAVAPLSRRALPHAARDIDAAVVDLREGRAAQALERLSAAERSLRMTFVRRPLESVLAAISRHKDRKTEPDADERERLAFACVRGRGMLFQDGKPLDHGFARSFIIPTVVPKISAVVDRLHANGRFDARAAYGDFSVGVGLL